MLCIQQYKIICMVQATILLYCLVHPYHFIIDDSTHPHILGYFQIVGLHHIYTTAILLPQQMTWPYQAWDIFI